MADLFLWDPLARAALTGCGAAFLSSVFFGALVLVVLVLFQ